MMMNWDVASEAEKGMNCANCSTVFDSTSKKAHKFLLSDGDPQKPILREITILESLSELFNLRSLSQWQWQCNESGSSRITENTQTNSKFLSVRLCASCANLLAQLYKLYFDFNRIRNKSSFLEREIQHNLHTLTLKNKNNSDNSDSSCSSTNIKKNDQSKVKINSNNNSNLFNHDRDTRTENMRGQIITNNPQQQKNPVSNNNLINSYHHQHHQYNPPPPPSHSYLSNQIQQQQQQQDRIITNNINSNNKATIIIQDTPKLLSYSKPKSLIMSHYNNSNNNTDDDEGPIIVDCKSMSKEQQQTQPNYNPTVPFLLHQALTSRSPSYSPKESKSNNNSNSNESSIIRTNKLISPILHTQESTERSSNVMGMNLNRGSIVIQTRTVSELEITRITDRITDEISPPHPPRNINNKVNNINNSSSSTSSSNQEHWRKRHCNSNLDSKNNKFSKIIIENPPNNDNKTFKCGECRAVFDSFQLLSSHIQLHLPGADKFYNEAVNRKKSTERN